MRSKLRNDTFRFFFPMHPHIQSPAQIMRATRGRVREPWCRVIVAVLLGLGAVVAQAAASDLFRQTDRFDQVDKADLGALISRANSCLRARDFDCVERQLQAAGKLAFTSGDKQQIAAVKQAMAAEKKAVANEEAELVAAARSREQSDRNAALLELCQRSCPIQWQAYMCVGGSKAPESCDASEGDYEARKSNNNNSAGDAVRAGAASVLSDYSRISGIHNNMVANLQAQQAERLRQEQEQRDRARDRQQRADAERRAAQRQEGQVRDQNATRESANVQQQRRERDEQLQRAREQQEAARRAAERLEQERKMAAATQPPAPLYNGTNSGRSSGTKVQAAAPEKSMDSSAGDADGCIEAIGWCSTPHTLEMRGRTAVLRFKNTCPFRVYGDFYNGLTEGGVDDGASGVAPGATHTWSSQGGSGRSFIRVIGSARSGNDWVCQAKKLPGFMAGDSTLERNK